MSTKKRKTPSLSINTNEPPNTKPNVNIPYAAKSKTVKKHFKNKQFSFSENATNYGLKNWCRRHGIPIPDKSSSFCVIS